MEKERSGDSASPTPKRRYQAPRILEQSQFEARALGCGTKASLGAGCGAPFSS